MFASEMISALTPEQLSILEGPAEFENDREFVEFLIDRYGLYAFRDVWACRIAGHSNIEAMTTEEWSRFCDEFEEVLLTFYLFEGKFNGRYN